MGMSASQARLLSITARINHVELETQYLSNAKIRLSDSTQKASDKYVAALNKTEYQYNYYNAAGEKITMDLTGAALTEYGELKNQYGLINAAGQILVSETDAANFENSNTLEEFLEKYGVLGELGEGDIIQVTNPEYTTAWDKYYDEYNKWMGKKPDPNDEKYIISGTIIENSLYDKFLEITADCFNNAAGNNLGDGASRYPDTPTNCFMHVLVDIIGPGEHTTSTGETFEAFPDSVGFDWNRNSHARTSLSEEVTEEAKNSYCSGDVIPNGEETITTSYGTVTVGGPTSDPNMTVYQRAVDLLWEVHDEYGVNGDRGFGGPAQPETLKKFWYFIEHDLKSIAKTEDQIDYEQYEKDLAEWEAKGEEIKEPDVPQFIDQEVRKIEDLDKAQWYVNLWHRMNGTSDFKAGFGNSEDYIAGNGWASKSETDQNWAVLKDGDMNSPEYLKYAIENGLITIEQVQFTDPSESGSGIENAVWTSIVFSSAQDITEQKDQVAITIAETEYNQTLREIEAKDKEYDTQIKKLDTEHNALQTEYDSIKSVIEKNVERSFKIFS